jgi:hypothetical protein
MKNEKKFNQLINDAWESLKMAFHPKYHAKLRNTLLKIIAAEDTEFADFVELMKVSGYDTVFQNAAGYEKHMKGKEKTDKINKELAEIWEATEPAAEEESQVTHQCHYCGDMYHVSDLTGAKMGLICYKCRHEMENRD